LDFPYIVSIRRSILGDYVEFGDNVRRKFQSGSIEILSKVLHRRCAGYQQNVGRALKKPGKGDLHRISFRSKRMLCEYGAPTLADVEWADGIIFGTPTRFGNTSAELKAFIDSLGGLWVQGKLNGKAAGAFTSTAGPHGGNETTVVSLYIPMAHLGFIIVPIGYTGIPTKRFFRATGRRTGRHRPPGRTAPRPQPTTLKSRGIRVPA
jgi:hypothetical protein